MEHDHEHSLHRRHGRSDGAVTPPHPAQTRHHHHDGDHADRDAAAVRLRAGGAIDTGDTAYVDYLLPGILLVTVASGVAYTSYRLFLDLKGGIFEREFHFTLAHDGGLVGRNQTDAFDKLAEAGSPASEETKFRLLQILWLQIVCIQSKVRK